MHRDGFSVLVCAARTITVADECTNIKEQVVLFDVVSPFPPNGICAPPIVQPCHQVSDMLCVNNNDEDTICVVVVIVITSS